MFSFKQIAAIAAIGFSVSTGVHADWDHHHYGYGGYGYGFVRPFAPVYGNAYMAPPPVGYYPAPYFRRPAPPVNYYGYGPYFPMHEHFRGRW